MFYQIEKEDKKGKRWKKHKQKKGDKELAEQVDNYEMDVVHDLPGDKDVEVEYPSLLYY